MDIYLLDWASLLLRWLHVITVIAWIGASFYFVWLDNHLVKPGADDLKAKGVDGELWAVHGGGFYNPQKYMVAPKALPENLHWSMTLPARRWAARATARSATTAACWRSLRPSSSSRAGWPASCSPAAPPSSSSAPRSRP